MQGSGFKVITDDIKKVIDVEEGFLRALQVDVITLRRNNQNQLIKKKQNQ